MSTPDTRSQVYGGVAAQTPSGDAAEAATRGEVVDYAGQPATTYFFSSSGGYTESVQNAFLGVAPEAWLIGVPDPYDDADGNPYYRWHENLSVGAAAHRLGKLVKGSLEGIKVLQRGVSPRIVQAAVVGTEGHDRRRRAGAAEAVRPSQHVCVFHDDQDQERHVEDTRGANEAGGAQGRKPEAGDVEEIDDRSPKRLARRR